MYVVLAEFDKGPMLGRKREKLFSGNCPKKYPGKDVLEIVLKISWERFKGGRLQEWLGSLKVKDEVKRENPTEENYNSRRYHESHTYDHYSPSCQRDVKQVGMHPHGKQPENYTTN